MKRLSMALGALALLLTPIPATAQDKLVVSIWGGSWRDMAANIIGKKFTAETGVPVEYITGGTIDRLNKETNAGLADARLKVRLADLGGTLIPGSPADFGKLIADETEKWGKVIRAANIRL